MLRVSQLAGFYKAGGGPPPAASFRNYYEDTGSASVYTFSSSDLGTSHSTRMVVVVLTTSSTTAVSTLTIGGQSASQVITTGSTSRRCEIWQAAVPSGATGDIVVTFGSSAANCAIGVYATYPASQTAIDALGSNNSADNNRTLTDLAKTAGGFAIFGSTSATTGTSMSVSYTGESVVRDRQNTSFDALKAYAFHSVMSVSSTTTADDPSCSYGPGFPTDVGFVGATWA